MKPTLRHSILEAYRPAKQHFMPEFRDDQNVVLLVCFRLGDLRELEAERPGAAGGETTILSGG